MVKFLTCILKTSSYMETKLNVDIKNTINKYRLRPEINAWKISGCQET